MSESAAERTALITGVSGQDGVYLARLLAAEGTHVIGTVRPGTASRPRCAAYLDDITIVEVDIRDRAGLAAILDTYNPDELYNLAAFTSVGASWESPDTVAEINATAVEELLDAVRLHRDTTGQSTHVFHASSAEVAAGADSPYAEAKASAEDSIVDARNSHGLHACFATLHNHESPLRGPQFVTRKITQAAARIHCGGSEPLILGNLDVQRDWGFAGDYVDAMRRMNRLEEPADFAIGTGVANSLSDLVTSAFAAAGMADAWAHVVIDPELFRPNDLPVLVADPEPAQAALGWSATVEFDEVIALMVAADIERITSGIEEDPRYLAAPVPTDSATRPL